MATLLSPRSEASGRVAPVRELFTHVAECRGFMPRWSRRASLELRQGHFARVIERRHAELPRAHGMGVERRAALAGALLSLMSWWIDRVIPASPCAGGRCLSSHDQ
jgi:hypothetical protein